MSCKPILMLLVPILAASQKADLRDSQFMARAKRSFAHIFNLDYDLAAQTFSALAADHPKHPAPPLYLAVTTWLRELFEREDLDLDKFLAPAYFTEATRREMRPQEREAFFDYIEQTQELCQAVLKEDPDNKDARYFLGTSYGVLGAFSITIEHSKAGAFKYGKQAYKHHSQLVQEDPAYYDSYMSVGLYEYIVDNLPWYIKWLAVIIGYRGSEERGFEYLKLAAEKGLYVADDARVLLMVLEVREEEYAKALQRARYLHQKYPRSFLLHLNRAQILEKMGEEEEAARQYLQILQWAEERRPNYSKLNLATFRYTGGRKFMELGRWELALEQFHKSVEDPQTPERERALSHLKMGQSLDVLGRRKEALLHYEQVLKLRQFEGSHKQACALLRRPYQIRRRR